ncbi:MAG: DUF134 domain-containing protein [Bacillota bacterium]|nr:DUF134 domain-containing protein [Bacillota bacterium]MDW7684433.1 DUF134 domain-containing protein [Bacillota bacterium]
MPRPPKCRRVEFEPQVKYFKPAGIPKHELQELVLSVEELEAVRLKDKEGLEQEECAERMQVSRPTFQRILAGARAKLAEALIDGKAIRVEGGNYCFAMPHHGPCEAEAHCPKCGGAKGHLRQGKE